MAAFEALAAGAKADDGTGAAADASAHARLALNYVATLNAGVVDQLDIWTDAAPAAAGPFSEIHHIVLRPNDPPGSPFAWTGSKRVCFGGFDDHVRIRWRVTKRAQDGSANLDLAVSGTGV